MSNIEKIKFQKINIDKFSNNEKMSLLNELKRRKISCRLTPNSIYFDERYLKYVKDIIPSKYR
jgi:hypothetical protein